MGGAIKPNRARVYVFISRVYLLYFNLGKFLASSWLRNFSVLNVIWSEMQCEM